jgi:Tol biopolymer transport system component
VIAFATDRYGSLSEIALMDADGGNVRRLYVHGDRPSWSPDGAQIAFHLIEPANLDECHRHQLWSPCG